MSATKWENYQVAFPNVVSESFEDETVAVNLVSGTYFTMTGTAAFIWNCLDAKVNFQEVMDCLGEDISHSEISDFVQQLVDFALIVPLTNPVSIGGTELESAARSQVHSTPKLTVYSDLQDILLLDPVHDVDSAGWPVADQND